MKIEEENILVESKDMFYVFSMNYIEETLYISAYSKSLGDYLVEDHAIINKFHQNVILEQIRKPSGTIFRNNHGKFLIKNHDIIGYKNESGRRIACNHISTDSVYDSRNTTNISILSRIIPFLKGIWLQI